MSKVTKLIKTPKLFFKDMVNKKNIKNNNISENKGNVVSLKQPSSPPKIVKKPAATPANNNKKPSNVAAKTATVPPKPATVLPKAPPSIETIISSIFNLSNKTIIDNAIPTFLYFPWIQEHSNQLIEKINSCAKNEFTISPLHLAKDINDKDNRKLINKFSRENPDIYKKVISRSLMQVHKEIKGFIFTLDWNPALRIIVDVCREYGIPTILVPHESIFIDRNSYYTDITALASVPKTDYILSWGSLQTEIFSERGYPKERIYEVGTPKFDTYHNYEPLISKAIFCKSFGFETDKKTILFTAQPLDSQLDQKAARLSQQRAIQNLFDYTEKNNMQLLLRMPPSKDQILGNALKTRIESSDHAAIDDANFYLVPPEEAIYHTDFVASINSTMLFEGVLMGKYAFSMKYVEFDQIWEKAGIPAVRTAGEMSQLIDSMLAGEWEHPQEGIDWAARVFSVGAFDGQSTQRITKKIKTIISDIDCDKYSIMPSAVDRFFKKEKTDVIAIPSSLATLANTQKYLKHLVNANTIISTQAKEISLSKLSSVDVFFQWGITPSQTKARQKKIAKSLAKPLLIIEDGFIRSVKIGLSGSPTLSIIADDTTAYYDATKQSRLERLIQHGSDLTLEQSNRARNAIDKIVKNKVSKYNDSLIVTLPIGRENVEKVLLIDQRNGDQSVPAALASEKSFEEMLANAIKNHSNADIIVKQHPDAIKGGKSSYFSNDLIEKYKQIYPHIYAITLDINPYSMFELVNDVYVVSSGVGFEALMAGKNVHCYGMPYYAGWGITNDNISLPRRSRNRNIEDIFHYAFIESSRYFNPDKQEACEVEEIIDYIAQNR